MIGPSSCAVNPGVRSGSSFSFFGSRSTAGVGGDHEFRASNRHPGRELRQGIDDNCRGVNLDPVRLKECFLRNGDRMSSKCQGDYPRAFSAIEQRVSARATLSKLCNWEMNHLCGEVRQDPVKGLQC